VFKLCTYYLNKNGDLLSLFYPFDIQSEAREKLDFEEKEDRKKL